MKEQTRFQKFVSDLSVEQGGEPLPEENLSEEEVYSTRAGQICKPIHEVCLRRFVLFFVRRQLLLATELRDDIQIRLNAELAERCKTAPKTNMVAFLGGVCANARTTDKKKIYQSLEKMAKLCKVSTHW